MDKAGAVERVSRLIAHPSFSEKNSDERFMAALSSANRADEPSPASAAPQRVETAAGNEIGRISMTDKVWRLSIRRGGHDGFTSYLTTKLPELLQAYEVESAGKK